MHKKLVFVLPPPPIRILHLLPLTPTNYQVCSHTNTISATVSICTPSIFIPFLQDNTVPNVLSEACNVYAALGNYNAWIRRLICGILSLLHEYLLSDIDFSDSYVPLSTHQVFNFRPLCSVCLIMWKCITDSSASLKSLGVYPAWVQFRHRFDWSKPSYFLDPWSNTSYNIGNCNFLTNFALHPLYLHPSCFYKPDGVELGVLKYYLMILNFDHTHWSLSPVRLLKRLRMNFFLYY